MSGSNGYSEGDNCPLGSLHQQLGKISALCKESEYQQLGTLVQALESKGHPLLCLFLAAPFLFPAIPGVPVPFGIALIILGWQWGTGRAVYLPRRLKSVSFSSAGIEKTLSRFKSLLARVEGVLKPSSARVFRFERIFAFAISLNGFLLALPMPPGTNFPPAIGIILISLGVLIRDGRIVIVGVCCTLLTTLLFTGILVFGATSITRFVQG